MPWPDAFAAITKPAEPLAPYTHLKIGGPAEYFVQPRSADELAAVLTHCAVTNLPARVLGGGVNLLVRDDPLPGVDEFFPDELALTLHCSRAEATTLAEVALTLVERLPATWTALAEGQLDWPRARALAQELGWPARETEPELVAEVEAEVLPQAMELSVSRLRALTRKELIRRDAAASALGPTGRHAPTRAERGLAGSFQWIIRPC